MAKNLELVGHRETIELQHDGGIKRSDVAMPDVARHAGEEDGGVSAFETAHHRHFRNGMALPVIFAQEERVDPGGVAAHDHVLIVVGKNLRLDEVTRTEQIGDGARLAHGAEGALPETLAVAGVVTLQLLARQRRNFRGVAQAKMPGDIDSLEARQSSACRRRKNARAETCRRNAGHRRRTSDNRSSSRRSAAATGASAENRRCVPNRVSLWLSARAPQDRAGRSEKDCGPRSRPDRAP